MVNMKYGKINTFESSKYDHAICASEAHGFVHKCPKSQNFHCTCRGWGYSTAEENKILSYVMHASLLNLETNSSEGSLPLSES